MKKRYLKELPIVWGYFMYKCNRCGRTWRMQLEIGVEDHGENGRSSQPSPFIITCECGGLAQDDSFHITRYDAPRPAAENSRYFAYDDSGNDRACGIPSIYCKRKDGVKDELPVM